MATDYNHLLKEAESYVREFYVKHFDERYVYHNIGHAENVARAAEEISNHFQLDDKDFFSVVTAAWFHDTGYMINPENHEEEGSKIATDFLKANGVDDDVIKIVRGCIMATHLPQTPHNLLEEIICDADLYHLGMEDFSQFNKLMRKETEALHPGQTVDKRAWRENAASLLQNQHYHTDYCRLLLEPMKEKNLKKLKRKIEGTGKEEKKHIVDNVVPGEMKQKSKKEKEGEKIDRGAQTMFRISSGNNQHLSKLADYKAHTMVSVNSIIMSVTIGLLIKQLDTTSYLAIPTYLILIVCVLTIIFSVLATRPTLQRKKYAIDEINEKKINLLFFGNFYKMSQEEYIEEMGKIMKDPDFIYISMMKDIYSEGVILARKYRYLRISYDIFMYGIIISVLAFVIASVIQF